MMAWCEKADKSYQALVDMFTDAYMRQSSSAI